MRRHEGINLGKMRNDPNKSLYTTNELFNTDFNITGARIKHKKSEFYGKDINVSRMCL